MAFDGSGLATRVMEAASNAGKTISPEQVAQDIVQVREVFSSKGKHGYQLMENGGAYKDKLYTDKWYSSKQQAQAVADSINAKRAKESGVSDIWDTAMQQAFRGETATAPAQAANTQTRQTASEQQNASAQGVITGTEANKYASANTETESTAVNDNPAVHTPQEQAVIEAYKSSVDDNLAQFYQYAKKDQTAGKYTLRRVSERAADDIRNLTGQDVDGFKTTLDARQAWHINNDHGINGKADHSMADDSDVARMQYVLDNYGSATYGGTTDAYWEPKANGKNRRSPVVVFSKKVNGTYYVVEATPVTKAQSVYVVSAYMLEPGKVPFGGASNNKTEATTQLPNANALWFTAGTDSANVTSSATVPQSGQTVKQNVSATDSTAGK